MATFENITKELAVTGSTVYMPLPINNMVDREGYWFTYTPANVGNTTTGGTVVLYHWGSAEPLLNSASSLTIDGTIPLLVENWAGSDVTYYSSAIEHVGAGTNDITNTVEDDAIMFSHLGANAASDDAFYWDRLYIEEGSGEWSYYQYHKHLPSFYTQYEQGRETTSGGGYLVPEDKEYGYQISLRVSSGGTPYQSRLARVHTPSIGGAHNSHNDVTLPSTSTKNYMSGGLVRGTSNKYHYFYIAADSTEWEIFSRTYTSASGSFSAETSIGTFDLADPTFSYPNTTGGDQEYWPLKASCGDVLGSSVYFPVLLTNQTNSSNFDLEVWSFPSGNAIQAGDLVREVIVSNVSARPDAQCMTIGSKLYVVYSDSTNGGVSMHSYDGSTWTSEGNVITNDNPLRVHGFRYNSADTSYYMLLSGTQAGTGTNYTGPGMYSFGIAAAFAGYPHLDYDATNHGFTVKAAQATGHVDYDIDTGFLTKYTTAEPEGIASDKRILQYTEASPQYYRVKEVDLGGEEYYEHVIELSNGVKCGVGQASGLDIPGTNSSNILVSLFDFSDSGRDIHLIAGGLGADFTTGVVESSDGNVWLTGYTKSALVSKRDIKVHGFLRNIRDGSNVIDHTGIATDSNENYYVVGNHDDGYTYIVKYNKDFEGVWQKKFEASTAAPVEGYGIHVDASDNIYVCGSYQSDSGFPTSPALNDTYTASSSTWTWDGTTWELTSGTGSADGFVLKLDTDGAITWANSYGQSGAQVIKGITTVVKSSTTYVVFGMNSGTSCSMIALNEDGTVYEVNNVSNLNINSVSYNEATDGRFCFAGTNGSSADRFGVAEVDGSSRMIQWLGNFGTGTTNAATDIKHLTDADVNGDNAEYVVIGTIDSNSYVMLLNVDESAGFVYNVQKTWARSLASCEFNALAVEDYTNPNWNSVTGTNKRIHIAGNTTAEGRGSSAGLIVQYDSTGAIEWQNTLSFGGVEKLFAITDDGTLDNFVVVGSKTSHSSGTDAMLFRGWKHGLGLGNYHIDGNPTTAMWYEQSTLTDSANATSLSSISAPADSVGSYSPSSLGTTIANSAVTIENYDGSYGPNGTFQFWTGYIDLDDVQAYFNSASYRADIAAGKPYCYAPSLFNFYQVATGGDGSADDGNVFGYDIIEHSGGMMVPVGVTSGDINRVNTGASGVYDYIIFHVNKSTGNFMYFQNGSTSDEEIYAVTELADATIAIGGRSTGNLGSHTNIGGYDLFLGIHNMSTHTTEYYQTGSGFNDRIVGLHDIGGNKLAAVFSTSGAVGTNTNLGSEDIGVITFNYSTDIWGDASDPEEAWQTGSETSDIVTQNGHHSTILPDGRIAIVGHSAGFFADNNVTSGLLDSFIAILDRTTGTWRKYQTGTGSNDFTTSVSAVGNKLIIGGHTEAAIENGRHAVYWEFDAAFGINGKSSSV
jgi:hypothetical protein